jgi:hypothetical protein
MIVDRRRRVLDSHNIVSPKTRIGSGYSTKVLGLRVLGFRGFTPIR